MIENIYIYTFFSKAITKELDLVCDQAILHGTNATVVFQPGSWDATFWPAQKFMTNKDSGMGIIKGKWSLVFSSLR
jgi:hypothetical protein